MRLLILSSSKRFTFKQAVTFRRFFSLSPEVRPMSARREHWSWHHPLYETNLTKPLGWDCWVLLRLRSSIPLLIARGTSPRSRREPNSGETAAIVNPDPTKNQAMYDRGAYIACISDNWWWFRNSTDSEFRFAQSKPLIAKVWRSAAVMSS